jgi:hypothetical protein
MGVSDMKKAIRTSLFLAVVTGSALVVPRALAEPDIAIADAIQFLEGDARHVDDQLRGRQSGSGEGAEAGDLGAALEELGYGTGA